MATSSRYNLQVSHPSPYNLTVAGANDLQLTMYGPSGPAGLVGPTGPAGEGGGEAYQSDTAPDPADHPFWLNTTNGAAYLWYGTPPAGVWVNVSHEQAAFVPSVATFGAVGDSITDRSTENNRPNGRDSVNFDQRGWGALLEQISNRQVVGVGPTEANTYKVGILRDRDHGYSGITAHAYLNGDAGVYGDFIPIEDAIAANPDFFVVHIGTNDIPGQEASVVVSRIRALWAALVATGKPVIGTDILQRASSLNTPTIRDRINATNTALRLAWEADGLWSYRQWDDLITKDGSGYADAVWYPDNASISNPDGIHPGTALAYLMANDLKTFLATHWTGTPPTIPANGSASWVTPNAYVAGGTTLATGWAANFLGAAGVDTIYSKTNDAEGDWQRVEVVNEVLDIGSYATQGVYDRLTGAGVTPLIGTQIRPTARIRIPAGQGLAGVGISVQCVGATGVDDWTFNAWCSYQTDVSPISEFDATAYCDPFVVPAGTTQIWIVVTPGRGTGYFEFQKAGILKA